MNNFIRNKSVALSPKAMTRIGVSGCTRMQRLLGLSFGLALAVAVTQAAADTVPVHQGRQIQRYQSDMWDPFLEMRQMEYEMNRLFQNSMARVEHEFASADFSPRMDIVEEPANYVVTMDMPGMEKDKIDVQITEGLLTVSGERRFENKSSDKRVRHLERSVGAFERSIPIPSNVNAEAISAKYEKGILTVTLPKIAPTKEDAHSKKIAVT